MHLPLDWPRINQFPEYFTAEKGNNYTIINGSVKKELIKSGDELREGLDVKIKGGQELKLIVE